MKIVALCHPCRHQHNIDFDPAKGPNSAFADWIAKHPEHLIDFTWPERTQKAPQPSEDASWLYYAHNADVKVAYAASAAYTIPLASLATDANLLVGREATAASNATNKYLDYLIGGKITTATTPTADKQIEVYAVGAINDTPTYPDVFDGTDSAETVTNSYVKQAACKPLAILGVTSSSDVGYSFGPTSLALRFGGNPTAHVLFVVHNTAVNLNATGSNHEIKHTGLYATST